MPRTTRTTSREVVFVVRAALEPVILISPRVLSCCGDRRTDRSQCRVQTLLAMLRRDRKTLCPDERDVTDADKSKHVLQVRLRELTRRSGPIDATARNTDE